MKLLVAGASGFVGRRLCPALADAGHEVRAMTRRPDRYVGAGEPVFGDVAEPESLAAAAADCEAAYYLVHSLHKPTFEADDAAAAEAFAVAAADAGLSRIVYLGGLGDDDDILSAHLRSRRQVEKLLGSGGVPVTTLRAGIIVGCGGISWEMTRQLVEHLPVMITPRWVHTRTQPIAVAETLVLPVPLLTPALSSRGLSLVTDVDVATGRSLVDSMTNEVVVRDDNIRKLVPFEPMDYDTAVLQALGERAKASRR